MAKLVTKFRYYKPGGRKKICGYAKYIALREGVEKCDDSKKYAPVSYNQKQLIQKIRSAYKPHKDTEGCDEQWESLRKRIKGLEKEFGKSIPLSETEMQKQLDSVIALASDCIRLSATVEYEQSEQAAVLSLE